MTCLVRNSVIHLIVLTSLVGGSLLLQSHRIESVQMIHKKNAASLEDAKSLSDGQLQPPDLSINIDHSTSEASASRRSTGDGRQIPAKWQLRRRRRQEETPNWTEKEEEEEEKDDSEELSKESSAHQFIRVADNVQTNVARQRNQKQLDSNSGGDIRGSYAKYSSRDSEEKRKQKKLAQVGEAQLEREEQVEDEARIGRDNLEVPSQQQQQQSRIWASTSPVGQPNEALVYARRPKSMGIRHKLGGILVDQQTIGDQQGYKQDTPNRLRLVDNFSQLQQQQQQQQSGTIVQALLGETARLFCKLKSNVLLQEQSQVSWVRNMQILTISESRYTSDERFRPIHLVHSNDWILEIHNVQASDEGDYECQINSEPKISSSLVHLVVLMAHVEILEAPEINVFRGEQILLTCLVEFTSTLAIQGRVVTDGNVNGNNSRLELGNGASSEKDLDGRQTPSATMRRKTRSARDHKQRHQSQRYYIYWFRNNLSLEYNNPRGDIKVQRNFEDSRLSSVLHIDKADYSDGGNYTCKLFPELKDVSPADVRVIVGYSSLASAKLSTTFLVQVITQATFIWWHKILYFHQELFIH